MPAMAAAASIISGVILRNSEDGEDSFDSGALVAVWAWAERVKSAPGRRVWPRPAAEQTARKRLRVEDGRELESMRNYRIGVEMPLAMG